MMMGGAIQVHAKLWLLTNLLCVLAQAFICVGILVAYLVGLPYQHNTPQAVTLGGSTVSWWRIMFIIGLIPAISQVCISAIMPCAAVRLAS